MSAEGATSALFAALAAKLPGAVVEVDVDERLGERVITIAAERLREALRILRDDEAFGFEVLSDLTAVDRAPAEPRFELVYQLRTAAFSRGLRVRSYLDGEECEAQSVVALWPAAAWLEREVWDLYGIRFVGHPDLRRLLLDEAFVGHPLRKDYAAPARGESSGERS